MEDSTRAALIAARDRLQELQPELERLALKEAAERMWRKQLRILETVDIPVVSAQDLRQARAPQEEKQQQRVAAGARLAAEVAAQRQQRKAMNRNRK